MSQQAPNVSPSSALLRCLSRLDVDAWAQVLLPKLVRQGSAHAFALTCSQLQDLCYTAVQELKLSNLADADISDMERWVQSVPQHFQHCTSVQLLLQDDASCHAIPYMLPALARLPKLNTISLRVDSILQPVCLVLHMLRTQLARGLRCLCLDLQQSGVGAARTWTEVGQCTMLTKLHIDFGNEVFDPVVAHDLLPLANLHSLQELGIHSSDGDFQQPLLSAQLAGGLTSLTSLVLAGCPVPCLGHVSSLTALQVLAVYYPSGEEEELGQPEWAAVGQLTGLTKLTLFNAKVLSPSDECRAALGKLCRLQTVGAAVWSVDVVSALAPCTQLTAIAGSWQQGSSHVDCIKLPRVQHLAAAWGCPPFAALPKLVTVEQAGRLSAAAFSSMAQHCTGLQELALAAGLEQFTSLPVNAPRTAWIAAVKALSALTSLTRLDFMLQDSAELAALVDVVGTLLSTGVFCYLGVYLLCDLALQLPALMPLAKLQGLHKLVLQPHPDLADEIAEHAAGFLGGLSGIDFVSVVGLESDVAVEKCLAAWEALRAAGLSCPKSLSVIK